MLLQDSAVIFEPDEQALMQAARRDVHAFAPLYELYCPRIYAYCYRRVSSRLDAEDLTSQIFTKAMTSLKDFRGGSVAAWLFRIAHNTVVNHLRDRRAELSIEGDEITLVANEPHPIEILIATEDEQRLYRALTRLPEAQRDLLTLKLAGGLSAPEIGEVLGKSAGAIRVEIHRIISQLRETILAEETQS